MAGGIVQQMRREKRTTMSEVIVRGKQNIKQNRNWFYFNFSLENSSLFGFTRVSLCQNLLQFILGHES